MKLPVNFSQLVLQVSQQSCLILLPPSFYLKMKKELVMDCNLRKTF